MAKKAGGRKKAGRGNSAAATPKKTKKSTKKKTIDPDELSDLDATPLDQRKAPPENIMPLLVPHIRQNAARSTRTADPQPPADVYIPPIVVGDQLNSPGQEDDCDPLDHTLPYNGDPPASFVEAACAAAAEYIGGLDVNNEDTCGGGGRVNLEDTFDDLVGNVKSGLDDLTYSSAEDDEDYDNDMEDEARMTEYSNNSKVRRDGQPRPTNIIPGGPTPPSYAGMNEVEEDGEGGVHKAP